MNIETVIQLASARSVTPDLPDRDVSYAFAADLMSDVLTVTENGVLFITGLATTQTIRTAMVSDIRFVLLVRGKKATAEMITMAREHDIYLAESPFSMYRVSGLLFAAGLKAIF